MKDIHRRTWKLALPYQDNRNNKGHIKTVLKFARTLTRRESTDEDIVIPAVILHDIGWGKIPKLKRFGFRMTGRRPHEIIGSRMAEKILKKVRYDTIKTKEIIKIVNGHDTRKTFLSKNGGIVRDADKLWRYSRAGLLSDVRNYGKPPSYFYEYWGKKINKKGYFYSRSAKRIATEELKKRKKEFGL